MKFEISRDILKFFLTVHHSIELFHQPTLTLNLLTTTIVAPPSNVSKWQMGFNSAFKGLMHNFLYSLTICLLHYYPRHISSINMTIFRRKIVFTQHLVPSLSVNVCTAELSTSVLCRRLQRAKIPDAL